ncbi:DUF429 domain-containing protein [Brevibacterium sp. CFH 10365]|uniref:DUF429 domain-containing protein n=1 Tax=Brevibacterium sp. CFH 10365 TaxID=2585207 RepID=UPI0012663209|nr:DUF429 domain-containing protein [Brevibacterium sp. CFH 10365]
MKVAGVDLAAEADRTGLAILNFGEGESLNAQITIDELLLGADDDAIRDAIVQAGRTGIDVPLGWPQKFVEFVSDHASGTLSAPESTDREWRRGLALRETDRYVQRAIGVWPLSVATERIAYAAMRWAGIEAHVRAEGVSVARDGSGVVYEVYPAAALKAWGLQHRGYKGQKNSEVRHELVDDLSAKFLNLEWNGQRDFCVADDNALDAVLAAIIALEAYLGRCEPVPAELQSSARREGWIWVPRDALPD